MCLAQKVEIQWAKFGDSGSDKAPGPDGFIFAFIKEFWPKLEPLFKDAMDEFHMAEVINKGSNSSFITLNPKVIDASKFANFRPISLCGVIYKAIAKTLANRLKSVVREMISCTLIQVVSRIINTHEGIRRKFLWGGRGNGSKIRWVAWEKIMQAKEKIYPFAKFIYYIFI